MKDGPSEEITVNNVERIYSNAARAGNVKIMLDIDESALCLHIEKNVRLAAICSILKIAPFPIMQYYLAMPFKGVTVGMRKQIVEFAVLHEVISKDGADLYLPNFQRFTNTTAPQTASGKPPTKRRYTI